MSNTFFKSAKFIGAAAICCALSSVAVAAKAAPKPAITPDVSELARTTIAEDFPDARHLVWAPGEAPDLYTAYFMEHRARNVARVDKDGELLSVLKYYGPHGLPEQVQSLLANKYPGKSITGVTEFDVYDSDDPILGMDITYQVTLQDADHFYQVRISDNRVEETQVLDKA
jgi:hypothetical protein